MMELMNEHLYDWMSYQMNDQMNEMYQPMTK